MSDFGLVLFLLGLLAMLAGIIWLVAAAIQKEAKKLPAMFIAGGVAIALLGMV